MSPRLAPLLLLLVCVCVCVFVLAGCVQARTGPDAGSFGPVVGPPSAPVRAPLRQVPPPAPPAPYAADLVAGRTVQGREIPVHLRGLGPDVCLLIATIHGNEPAGTPLLERLLAHLDANPALLRGRRVVAMPVANPDGYAARTRANANGVDLNRNFEAPNRRDGGRYGDEALSEPEAVALRAVVRQFHPSRVLSLHQPLRCVDWDGPAESLAKEIAAATDLPVKKLGTRPGSMGAWAEATGLALVTVELPSRVESLGPDELWRRYGDAILLFVQGGR